MGLSSNSCHFADDSCSIVSGDNLEQLDENIKTVVMNREEWYHLAGLIKVHRRLFSIKDECLLFSGWKRGAIHANALVFLPFLKKGEIDDRQSAMNAGIRVVMGLRRFGYAGISILRKNIQIQSISEISTYVISKAAWEKRSTFF